MSKSILRISLLLGLYCGSSQAMDIRSMTPAAIIGTSLAAGVSLQLVKWVREEQRYKQILPFMWEYPGAAIAGLGTVIGLTLMYGRPLASMFYGASLIKPN